MSDTLERYRFLTRELAEHNRRYYLQDAPTVTDAEYDSLMRELRVLEDRHPEWVTAQSPTQMVGADIGQGALEGATFAPIRHINQMLSLDNAFEDADLEKFEERAARVLGVTAQSFDYTVELKIDGLSINILYVEGVLEWAATRGNGFVGDGDKIGAGDHHANDIDGENGEHGWHIDHRLTACKQRVSLSFIMNRRYNPAG